MKMANSDVKAEEISDASNKTNDETKTNENEEKIDKKPLTDEIKAQVVRQVEYYYGDINLPRDKFLKEQTELDDGWVPITVLLTFNRLNKICSDEEAIGQAISESNSTLLNVSDDLKKIRRSPDLPVPEFNNERKEELQKRTAYAKGFPATATLEELMKYFLVHGENDAIHMRHYVDKATKKPVFKGSVFVIFKDVETCKKFIEVEEVKYNDTPITRKWQTAYFDEKKIEREERSAKRGRGKKEPNAEEKVEHKFPKGSILHMEGFTNEETAREKIKSKIEEVHGSEPAYITFNKGDKEGYVRFGKENEAVEFLEKVTDNKIELDGNELQLKVLEGEEEETFLTNLSATLGKIRQQNRNNKNSRGRKRKGFGGDGPRSKHQRK